MEKEIAWRGRCWLVYTQGFDSLCYLTFRNLTKYKYRYAYPKVEDTE